MPHISAFRGIRYDLGHVGSLSDVIAPPYDVIDPELQDQLYKKHPANVVRLILNRDEPGDDEQSQPLHAGRAVPAQLAARGRAVRGRAAGDLRVPPGVRRGRADVHRGAGSWRACGWSGSARATSTRTRRRTAARRPTGSSCGRRAGRTSARSLGCIRIPRTRRRTFSSGRSSGRRRWWRPTIWESCIACGR